MSVRTRTPLPRPQRSTWIEDASFIVALGFDVHPMTAQIHGDDLDWDLLRRFFREVQPDLVLVESLGYWGWATFQSNIAPYPEGLEDTFLEEFRKVCTEEGVRFGMYVESWQTVANARPFSELEMGRWFRVDEKGEVDPFIFCPNSPFGDEFLTPFCLELMERFRPEALWFDHSRTRPCFCGYCRKRFREQNGTEMPSPDNANLRSRIEEFSDTSLVVAMEHCGDLLHQSDPDLVLCWPNALDTHTVRSPFRGAGWMSSDEVNVPDLKYAQFDCTYRSTLGVPSHLWVSDSARFTHPRQRPQEQLYAEASTVVAHGCGMTMYPVMNPRGVLELAQLDVARDTAKFIRDRVPFCLRNESHPHVAVLASLEDNLRYADRFQPCLKEAQAVHEMLSQNHVPCEVVNDDILIDRLQGYQTVILGEVRLVHPETARALEDYVAGGGTVLVIGPAPAVSRATEVTASSPRLFNLTSATGDRVERHLLDGRVVHVGRTLRTESPVEVICRRVDVEGNEQEPLFVKTNVGDGVVYWLLSDAVTEYGGMSQPTLEGGADGEGESVDEAMARINFGVRSGASGSNVLGEKYVGIASLDYSDRPFRDPAVDVPIRHPNLRWLVGRVVTETLGDKWLLRAAAPPGVEFVVNSRDGDVYVHLVNHTCGFVPDGAYFCMDSFPALADISFDIRLDVECDSIESLPDGDELTWERTDQGYRVHLGRLRYHTAVRFKGAADGGA